MYGKGLGVAAGEVLDGGPPPNVRHLEAPLECDTSWMRSAAHIGIGLILASLVLASCSSKGREGATALWVIDTAAPPVTTADSFVAMVTRLGCSGGGKTGEVFEPTLVFSEDEVVVTFSVEPFEGDATCPGNDEVPYVVDLGQPLGDRKLVDGACLAGEAVSTSFCADGPFRWKP